MNKTVTINISGIVFHIEVDAYERLHLYLESLRRKFQNEEGRDEILADIESRIAEILTAKKGPSREVVVMKDIEEVIAMMGEADAFEEESNHNENQTADANEQTAYENRSERRRLYRDPDDKVIGGVCSGLAHYFDMDPVWLRLGFAVMFFVGGTGFLFYILLLIIIPKATTTAEKLEMRGEPVDVNNISRTIKEEFEEFGQRVKDFGSNAKKTAKDNYDYYRHRSRPYRRGPEDFFRGIFHVIGRFFAFCLVAFGVLFLIGLLTSTLSVTDLGPDMFAFQVQSMFEDGFSYAMGIAAFLLFFGIPILMMIYYGIKILFRIQKRDTWVSITALSLWFVGIVLGIVSVSNIASGFSESSEQAERIQLTNPHADTLTVRVNIDPDMINDDYDTDWNRRHHFRKRWKSIHSDDITVKFGFAGLNIVPSNSDSAELIVYRAAMGRDRKEAHDRCSAIQFPVTMQGNEIVFPSAFTIGNNQAWKNQEVDAELRLPAGTVIYIDGTCADMLYDVKNVSNTLDEDMADRRWIMTKSGLQCVDCAGLEIRKGDRHGNVIISGEHSDTLKNAQGDTFVIPKH